MKQATVALIDPEDYRGCDNLGLEDLFAEMTPKEGLNQRTQALEMDSGNEAIIDVPNDHDHESFKDFMEIDYIQRETIRTRGGRVIKKWHTHLDDYGV